jgi:hypothetical protein
MGDRKAPRGNEVNEIVAYDLWGAGFLMVNGVPLLRVVPGDYARFVFDNTGGQAVRALGAWNAGAQVSAKAYSQAIKQLKRMGRLANRDELMIGVESNGNGSING